VVGLDAALVAQESTTISSTAVPSFSFTFLGALQNGLPYQVHYWIDSNDSRICDPAMIDHQWSGASFRPQADAGLNVVHDDADNSEVCSRFEF